KPRRGLGRRVRRGDGLAHALVRPAGLQEVLGAHAASGRQRLSVTRPWSVSIIFAAYASPARSRWVATTTRARSGMRAAIFGVQLPDTIPSTAVSAESLQLVAAHRKSGTPSTTHTAPSSAP